MIRERDFDADYPPIAPGVTYLPTAAVTASIATDIYTMAQSWGGNEGAHFGYCAVMKVLDLKGPVERVHDYFTALPDGAWQIDLRGMRR